MSPYRMSPTYTLTKRGSIMPYLLFPMPVLYFVINAMFIGGVTALAYYVVGPVFWFLFAYAFALTLACAIYSTKLLKEWYKETVEPNTRPRMIEVWPNV